MAKTKERPMRSVHEMQREKTFKLDGQFIKREAKEALKSYFMPFSGVYAAATGKKIIIVHDRDGRIRSHHEPAKKRA
jgi:hypothetical protein